MKKAASIKDALVKEKYLLSPSIRQIKRKEAREKVLADQERSLDKKLKALEWCESEIQNEENETLKSWSKARSRHSS